MKNFFVLILIAAQFRSLFTLKLTDDKTEYISIQNFSAIIQQNRLFEWNKSVRSLDDLKQFQLDLLHKQNAACFFIKHGKELNKLDLSLKMIKIREKAIEIMNATSESSLPENRLIKLNDFFQSMCLDIDTIHELFHIEDNLKNYENLLNLLQIQQYNKACDFCDDDFITAENVHQLKIPKWKAWLFGLTAATLITLTSFTGAVLYPLLKYSFFKKILMFLISLAIGTLLGTAVLHLIPQAFGLGDDLKYTLNHAYLWKSASVLVGISLFFIFEQIMRLCIEYKKHRTARSRESVNFNNAQNFNHGSDTELENLNGKLNRKIQASNEELEKSSSKSEIGIAPVAWIIIISESLHNLIDGLSIGCAFNEAIVKGLSLSIAIICEEFPHKLGDFAILLASGMSFHVALFCTFINSCFIYVGVVFGILFGVNEAYNQYVYAVAAGMFIYIAVCNMMPELSEMGVEIEVISNRKKTNKFPLRIKIENIINQNLGIFIGIVLMFVIAFYGENIEL